MCYFYIRKKNGKNSVLLSSVFVVKKRKMKDAIRPNLVRPPEKNKNKDEFFKTYNAQGFIKAYNKFVKEKFFNRVKIKMKGKIKGFINMK